MPQYRDPPGWLRALILGLGTQDVTTSAQTTSLIDYLTRHDHIQVGVTFSGFLLLLVAQIAVTAALFRSHVLPVWVPILFVVGAVLEVAFGSGGVPFALATISQTIATVAIGWAAHRKSVV